MLAMQHRQPLLVRRAAGHAGPLLHGPCHRRGVRCDVPQRRHGPCLRLLLGRPTARMHVVALFRATTSSASRELTNVSFWPVVPPVADARHGSALLSAVFLAMSIGPVGRLLMAEAIRRYHAPRRHRTRPAPAQHAARPAVGHRRQRALSLAALPEPLAHSRLLHPQPQPDLWAVVPRRAPAVGRQPRDAERRARPLRSAPPARRPALRHAGCASPVPRPRTDARVARRHRHRARCATGSRPRRPRRPSWPSRRHGTHQIGTMRMGADRHTGVVDRNLRSFDVRNLYVASSAVFPSSGRRTRR